MKFRIVECTKYTVVYYYIEIQYYFLFGLYKYWLPLNEYSNANKLTKFNTIEEAEEHIKKTYTYAKEKVIKEIEI